MYFQEKESQIEEAQKFYDYYEKSDGLLLENFR
jgi:hypothetical protein